MDEISQNAGGHEHDVGISGRREDMTYRIGLNYLDQKGVLRGSGLERLAASFNYSDRLLNDHLGLRTHLKGSRTKDRVHAGWRARERDSVRADAADPHDDRRVLRMGQRSAGPNNPIAELNLVQDEGTTLRSIGNIEAEVRIPASDWTHDDRARGLRHRGRRANAVLCPAR